ncbi:MAG: hypothetical protein ACOZIN_13350 [Myxococcota bacterium]
MLLLHSRERFLSQVICESNQGRPETAMDKGDFSIDQAKAEHIGRIIHCTERLENLGSFPVAPPAPSDGFTGDSFGQIGHSSFG